MNELLTKLSHASACILLATATTSMPVLAQPAKAMTPVRGGIAVGALHTGEPATYDCHATNTPSVMWRVSPHYSTLLEMDPDNYPNVRGDLAQSWKVSPDNLVYTFKLHPNIKFHDGSKLTSNDVKVSLDRQRTPPPGVVSVRQGLFADISVIETPDEQTVVVKFARKNNAALQTMAMPFSCVYSAKLLASDPSYPNKRVMGTGPFRFVRHVPGSEWMGERFPEYFRPGKPYLDGFRLLAVSPVAAGNALASGQVHFTMLGMQPKELERISAERGASVKAVGGNTTKNLMFWFALNTQREALKDPRVRRALNLALDRWSAAPAMMQQTPVSRVGALLRPGSIYARSEQEVTSLPGFGRDIKAAREEARRLLAEAGQTSLKLTMVNQDAFARFGVFAMDQWRQIGVTVEHVVMAAPQVAARRASGDYDLILDTPTEFVDDPSITLAYFKPFSANRGNLSRADDKEFEAMFDAQTQDFDPKSRLQRVRDLEAYLMRQSYTIPLFWQYRKHLVDTRLHGLDVDFPSNYQGIDMQDVWLDPEASR